VIKNYFAIFSENRQDKIKRKKSEKFSKKLLTICFDCDIIVERSAIGGRMAG